MYFVIRNSDDLKLIPQLMTHHTMFIRCVMNKCTWCHSSQPEWNNTVKKVIPHLQPYTAIAEIEREFLDEFANRLRRRNIDFPAITGFPSTVSITPAGVQTHEGRDRDAYLKVLKQIKAISPVPSVHASADPRFEIIEEAKGTRHARRRKLRKRISRKNLSRKRRR